MSGVFNRLLEDAKIDVNFSIEVWTELLEKHYDNKIKCAYAKGSALKNWETYVDYVPILSDLDMHILFKEGTTL
ncbi:MAG: hypothetical protein ACFFBD_16835, partial [Candidatus Hodarchaeota archaeon]